MPDDSARCYSEFRNERNALQRRGTEFSPVSCEIMSVVGKPFTHVVHQQIRVRMDHLIGHAGHARENSVTAPKTLRQQ